ncbi:MAG: PTS ascorbate transporter subunit IIC [Nannocystaceae bacterium]
MAAKKRFLLRMDPKLWAALERWAAEDLRSVNGQIEFLLTQAARRSGRLGAQGGGDDPYRGAPEDRDDDDDDDDA